MFYNNNMDAAYPVPETALVLVAIMPSARDMEIARLLGWYRIPLRKAPKVIDVDYLAFYQGSAFTPDERGRINFAARVKGHELTTRAELLNSEANHPRAREEYFKILIGPLLPLPKPVAAANWKRITFLYTTGRALAEAGNINDLVIQNEERAVLWRSLRERLEGSPHEDEVHDDLQFTEQQLLEILGYIGLDHR